jgi:hypothetical protein
MGEWRYSPTILGLDNRWRSRKEPVIAIGWEAGWAPEPIWTLWRKVFRLPGFESRPSSPSLY